MKKLKVKNLIYQLEFVTLSEIKYKYGYIMNEFDNLELGAGCGNFGKIFYPICCLTEKNEKGIKEKCGDTHYIDYFVDAYHLPEWTSNCFEKIIICNPYEYGFRDKDDGCKLMLQVIKALCSTGQLIIIGSARNPWCTAKKVQRTVEEFKNINDSITLELEEADIDSTQEYPNYIFYSSDGEITTPNKRIIVYVTKS